MTDQPLTTFLEECKADRDRMRHSLTLIDEGILTFGSARLGQAVIDQTASYRANLQRTVDDLELLITQLEAE